MLRWRPDQPTRTYQVVNPPSQHGFVCFVRLLFLFIYMRFQRETTPRGTPLSATFLGRSNLKPAPPAASERPRAPWAPPARRCCGGGARRRVASWRGGAGGEGRGVDCGEWVGVWSPYVVLPFGAGGFGLAPMFWGVGASFGQVCSSKLPSRSARSLFGAFYPALGVLVWEGLLHSQREHQLLNKASSLLSLSIAAQNSDRHVCILL